MPFSEFLEWQEYLRQEEWTNTKKDWQLARIAAEIRRSFVEDPSVIKISDFLFTLPDPAEVEAGEKRIKESKTAWASFLGVDLTKN